MPERFAFRFTDAYQRAGRPLGISPERASVTVDDGMLDARFGPWRVRTPVANVASWSVDGPYSFAKTAGPARLGITDRSLTFATNGERGLVLTFARRVTGIDPVGLITHPELTLTVAAPEALGARIDEEKARHPRAGGTPRRRVLITGASSGVGRAAVEAFARDGADLALLARPSEGLEATAQAVRALGATVVVVPADVTDRPAVHRAVQEAAEQLGGLDVLVSCAAAVVFGRFTDASPEDFDRTVAVCFTGAVNVIRAALPVLERSGGVVVSTGSLMSRAPLPTFNSYVAAKHALRGFLRTLRIELKAQHSPVRIAQVHPGALDTPLWEHSTSATGRRARRPPWSYTSATVAAELVAASHHRRPETTVGGEAALQQAILSRSGPLADLVLRGVDWLYASGERTAPVPGALWASMGDGHADGAARVARPSLTAPVRRALRVRGRLPSRPPRQR